MNPYDDETIQDIDMLIRRVNPLQHIVPDNNTNGGKRISTKLFSLSSGKDAGMSVDLLSLIQGAGIDAEQFVTTPVYTGAVLFEASVVRRLNLRVGASPTESNPYHGEVWGADGQNRFTSPQRKALLSACNWFVELAGVNIS